MWVPEGVTEIRQRVEQVPLLLLGPSPTYSVTLQQPALPHPSEHLSLHPFTRHANTKKKMAQMKEQIKAPKINQLSSKQIANLSDAQFKTLVIRMLTELVEFGHKLDEKMKAMLRETKENVQGTNRDGKETGTQINGVDQKEERNIQPEVNEETRIWKNEERLRNLQHNFKRSNIRIIGVPEGEEEEQNIENLFEQIMKDNFPSLAKSRKLRESQRSWTQGGTHQGTS